MAHPSNESVTPTPLKLLCTTSLQACEIMTPLITSIYKDLGQNQVKTKHDDSAFTIADGLVQRLLCVLFNSASSSFSSIVGEEDAAVQTDSWDEVNGLPIPHHILPLVQSVKSDIEILGNSLCGNYAKLTVFIDPIDGTREFSTGKGEQCSICIGFADEHGAAIGGVVYRPLTPIPTWAVGAKCEGFAEHNLKAAGDITRDQGDLLTSNGNISPFIATLIDELGMQRIRAGGAGNKMLLLLESSLQSASAKSDITKNSMLYIQDRGLSRWDTCAAEAVLEAFGGKIIKLTSLQSGDVSGRYTYLASENNLDFVPGSARLTKYNSADTIIIEQNEMAQTVSQVKPYSNLCGLVAFGKEWSDKNDMKVMIEAIKKAAAKNAPSYD